MKIFWMLTSIIWNGMMSCFYTWKHKHVCVDHSMLVETLEEEVERIRKSSPSQILPNHWDYSVISRTEKEINISGHSLFPAQYFSYWRYIGLAKKVIQIFLQCLLEKPERPFGPIWYKEKAGVGWDMEYDDFNFWKCWVYSAYVTLQGRSPMNVWMITTESPRCVRVSMCSFTEEKRRVMKHVKRRYEASRSCDDVPMPSGRRDGDKVRTAECVRDRLESCLQN